MNKNGGPDKHLSKNNGELKKCTARSESSCTAKSVVHPPVGFSETEIIRWAEGYNKVLHDERRFNKLDVSILCDIAQNPNTPSSDLNILARNKNVLVRLAVARSRNIDQDVYSRLMQDKKNVVRVELAKNESLHYNWLNGLYDNGNAEVRRAVTQNRFIGTDAAARATLDKDTQVRENIARNSGEAVLNPNKPILGGTPFLFNLVHDKKESVRLAAVSNSKITLEQLDAFASDASPTVQREVVRRRIEIEKQRDK